MGRATGHHKRNFTIALLPHSAGLRPGSLLQEYEVKAVVVPGTTAGIQHLDFEKLDAIYSRFVFSFAANCFLRSRIIFALSFSGSARTALVFLGSFS